MLLTAGQRLGGRRLGEKYPQRAGTSEEYNDPSERAYHREVLRTGTWAGLNALQSLLGLCWNRTRWATEALQLPPVRAPEADQAAWVPAAARDLSQVMQRVQHSGLRRSRPTPAGPWEVEDTAGSPESQAWLRGLDQPIQQRLRFAG